MFIDIRIGKWWESQLNPASQERTRSVVSSIPSLISFDRAREEIEFRRPIQRSLRHEIACRRPGIRKSGGKAQGVIKKPSDPNTMTADVSRFLNALDYSGDVPGQSKVGVGP